MESAAIKEAAQEIAKILDESNKNAIRQIERLIEHIGKDFVEEHIKLDFIHFKQRSIGYRVERAKEGRE